MLEAYMAIQDKLHRDNCQTEDKGKQEQKKKGDHLHLLFRVETRKRELTHETEKRAHILDKEDRAYKDTDC
jgi:hypothetical protein